MVSSFPRSFCEEERCVYQFPCDNAEVSIRLRREENHAQASFSGWRSQWFFLSRGRFAKKSDVFTSFLVTMQKSAAI